MDIIKKTAVTLATALAAATASAQGFSLWIDSPHHNRPQHGQSHGGAHHDSYPRHPQYPPYYRPVETAVDKCTRALFNRARLDIYHPYTQVGFIERNSFACRINTRTGRLTQAYNLDTDTGYNAYQTAQDRAYEREDEARDKNQYGHRPRW